MPHLARITVFPIKSLDGISLDEAAVLAAGALEYDRRLAICDADGNFVNGKRTPRVHDLRATYDLPNWTVSLQVRGASTSADFHLDRQRRELENWLSKFFDLPVTVQEDARAGFPDDRDAPGPTVVSTATLAAVASWFPGVSLDECRQRFRANLEIDGVEPFWEDRLIGAAGSEVVFRVGEVTLAGTNPCQRCVIPSRSPETGEAHRGFQVTFARNREAALPAWADRSRFNHFYRLAVNTRLPPGHSNAVVRVGDPVTIV